MTNAFWEVTDRTICEWIHNNQRSLHQGAIGDGLALPIINVLIAAVLLIVRP